MVGLPGWFISIMNFLLWTGLSIQLCIVSSWINYTQYYRSIHHLIERVFISTLQREMSPIFANASKVMVWLECFSLPSLLSGSWFFWLSSVSIFTNFLEWSDIQFLTHLDQFFNSNLTWRWQTVIYQNVKDFID